VLPSEVVMNRNCEKISNSTLADHADVLKYRDVVISACYGLGWDWREVRPF